MKKQRERSEDHKKTDTPTWNTSGERAPTVLPKGSKPGSNRSRNSCANLHDTEKTEQVECELNVESAVSWNLSRGTLSRWNLPDSAVDTLGGKEEDEAGN
jgi:hypothetical protein